MHEVVEELAPLGQLKSKEDHLFRALGTLTRVLGAHRHVLQVQNVGVRQRGHGLDLPLEHLHLAGRVTPHLALVHALESHTLARLQVDPELDFALDPRTQRLAHGVALEDTGAWGGAGGIKVCRDEIIF